MVPGHLPFHKWVKVDGRLITGIPHPSGLTRNYNDEKERERAGRTLRQAISKARNS
jgi:hypothetical protein